MKEEALKLADWLDKSIDADDWGELAKYYQWCHENVSPMIRRLVEELDKKKATSSVNDIASDADQNLLDSKEIIAQTKLSENEIRHIYQDYWLEDHGQIVDFVRAIEERHGIK